MDEEQQELKPTSEVPQDESLSGEELKDTEEPTDETPQDGGKAVDEYEAELERLRAERENYKQGMLSAKKKLKEKSFDTDTIEATIESRLDKIRQEQVDDTIDEVLSDFSGTQKEKELMQFHYENSVKHSGYSRRQIIEDVRKAKLLANESQILKQNKELAESLRSRATLDTAPSGASVQVKQVKDPRLTSKEKKLLDRFGAMNRFKENN